MSTGDPTPYITVTSDGTTYIRTQWPHQVKIGDTIVMNNTAYGVVSTSSTVTSGTITTGTGTMASAPYHGYPSGGIGQLSIYGPNSTPTWQQPAIPKVDISQYLPDREAHEFFIRLVKDHCSEGDAKELLMMLFDKLSTTEKENSKISPEVVTALLTFCIEKYA